MLPQILLATFLSLFTLAETKAQEGHNWLSHLANEKKVQHLHLPGTHNSAALLEPLRGTARCQKLTIQQQLETGVRFLDIRCRHEENQFSLYHGPISQNQSFAEFQETLETFLRKNPSECLLISIQETSQPRNNTRSFAETFRGYQAQKNKLWSLPSKLPKLGKIRGTALLIRRFQSKKPLGINATNWKSQGIHSSPQLLIQDQFQVPHLPSKWSALQHFWKEAPKHPHRLKLNFASGYQPNKFKIPNITAVSSFINPQLQMKLAQKPAPPVGVIVCDFIDHDLTQAIYSLNF